MSIDIMANGSIISEIKQKFIKEIITDKSIIKAIDSTLKEPDELVDTHIFRYNKNPHTIQEVITFMTIQVHIPQINSNSKVWVKPVLEVWIVSHADHMTIKNISKVSASRTDYISQLVDEKFNGRSDYGYGQMFLESNIEGVHPDNSNFLFRRMMFETRDLNDAICR